MANIHRQRGTGKGTNQIWANNGIEGELPMDLSTPTNLPVPEESAPKPEEKEDAAPEYQKEIKKYLEGLVLAKGKIGEILKARGLEPAPRHFKDVSGKIKEMLDECANYLVDELTSKYGQEKLKEAVLGGKLGDFPEIQAEAEKSVLVFFSDALQEQQEKAKSAEEKEWIKNQLEKLEPMLAEFEVVHVASAGNDSGQPEKGSESKKPEGGAGNIFEKAVQTEGQRLLERIRKGLDIIRQANAGGKEIILVPGADKSKINFNLLNDASRVNPDAENFLAELEKLSDFQNYPFDEFRSEINTHPEIIALKNSDQPKDEKNKKYGRLVFKLTADKIRKIFFENDVAGTGRALKTASHVLYLFEKGLVELRDSESKNEEPMSKEPTSEERRKEQILDIVRETFESLKTEEIENLLKRSEGSGLSSEDMAEIQARMELSKNVVIKEIAEAIYGEFEILGKVFDPGKIETTALIKIRERYIEHAKKYLNEKKENERHFSSQQMEELRDLLAAAKEFSQELEETETRQVIEAIIREELVLGSTITEDKVPDAVDYVARWVSKFRRKK